MGICTCTGCVVVVVVALSKKSARWRFRGWAGRSEVERRRRGELVLGLDRRAAPLLRGEKKVKNKQTAEVKTPKQKNHLTA